MIGVDKIDDIRRLGRSGATVASIARDTGVSEPTVRKYLREPDLSERPPAVGRAPESPLLEPFAETIDSWLLEDRRCWSKQRHTARKVYDRLVGERGFAGSCTTVQRYVKRRREELAAELDAREAQGFLLLDWLPGECQVDFGQADFRVRGVVTRGHFLAVAFPHSNVGLAQVFWGETAECVCQGLRDVFEFLGGVPLRAVFDNATEVGRRVGAQIVTSELFRRFAAHYGLDYSFTNPHSGNEKGSVENKVGALRRNLFVPVPQVWDVKAYNGRLLGTCLELSDGKPHYRKGAPESELFGDDRAALSPLPEAPFACVTWPARRCDKQGSFRAGGEHRYSAGPANASREVAVAMGAFDVTVVGAGGEVVAEYPREWGDAPTDSADPTLRLRLLAIRPGGWRDSVVRGSLPEELVAFLDSEAPADLGADLRALRDAGAGRGWAATVEGALRSLGATGGVDAATLELAAARAAAGDAVVSYDEPAGLAGYDRAFELPEGGRRKCLGSRTPSARGSPRARGRCSSRGRRWRGSSRPRPRGSSPRARGCSRASSSPASGRSGRGCCARRGSPCPRPSRGSTGNVRFPEGWGRDEMLSPGFVGRAEDLVFHGPTGRGKTHVATALGIEATRQGIPVRFFQTAALVLQLGKAKREGTLDRVIADIGKASLVVLDEFGYVPFDVDGARLLYQVISDSYERRSIVFTTNVEFSRWGTVFADDKLAAAIVDRVVHHGRLVEFEGPSHRLEESLMLGKSGS